MGASATSGVVSGSAKSRKPYQRPSVQKRRSVHQATLISSGGTSGTLTSGGPPDAKPQDLELPLIISVLDQAKALFDTKHVGLTGGEPALHP